MTEKWTDIVASVETSATDRSGPTLWQVWRPRRQRQKVKLKQDPDLSFREAGPEVSTQLIGKES